MSITVELYLDSAWRSVEAQQPIIINEALHNSLASATSSCRVNIIPNSTIKNYLLGLENADADIRIKDGSTVLFQGLIRKNFTIRKLEQRQDLYGLEAVGYLIKLDRKVKEDKQYISKSVSYIVEDLFTELGINYSLPTITSIINNLYIKRGESYRIIEQLLKEYGYILYVDNEGTARAIEISPASITTTETFYDSNTLDALELNKKEQDKERIEIEYRQQKTAASGIVFSDTTNAQGVYKCYIQLAAGAYLGGQQYVYADLVYDGKKVIALSSHTLDITADSGITVSTNILEGNKVKLSIQNTSGITKNIYKLDIIGSGIVYEDSAGKEIATSNSDTDKIETIQAKYLFTSTNAQSYAQKLLNYYKYSDFVYTLSSMTDATLGEQVLLDHEGIGSINARIIEKQKDYQTGKIRYKLEGISEYSAESSESEPAYTAPDPLNNQAIILTYPEQPTNNVTDVTASFSENADGTANVVVEFNYTQGEKPATQFLCYVLRSFSTPGDIDYFNDQAIGKPYSADGAYSIPFALPTRAGSAPIHYKIGVIAANGAKLHSDGAVIPTGWSDKTLTGGITYDENNYWDLDTGELRCGDDDNYIKITPEDGTFTIKGLSIEIEQDTVSNIYGALKMQIANGDLQIKALNSEKILASDYGKYSVFNTPSYTSSNIITDYNNSTDQRDSFTCTQVKNAGVFNPVILYKNSSSVWKMKKYYSGAWQANEDIWSSPSSMSHVVICPIINSTAGAFVVLYRKSSSNGIYLRRYSQLYGGSWSSERTVVSDATDNYYLFAIPIPNSDKVYIGYRKTSDSIYYVKTYDYSDDSFTKEGLTGHTGLICGAGFCSNLYNVAVAPCYNNNYLTLAWFSYDGAVLAFDAYVQIANASGVTNPNYATYCALSFAILRNGNIAVFTGENAGNNKYICEIDCNELNTTYRNIITSQNIASISETTYYAVMIDQSNILHLVYPRYNNANIVQYIGNIEWLNGEVYGDCGIGIIEEGTNSNGSYIKYSNGTMVCYGKKSVNTAMTVLDANVGTYGWSFYYLPFSAGIVVDLPASYLSSSSYIFISEAVAGKIYYPYHHNITASQVQFGYVAYDGGNGIFAWQTIGKWK